ncbi:ROK family protein [Lacibacterium aquatile]|uniref:ROK family protein n=1 Tax=Lacibacterium aquatile TaxID=1168082 RepID=A0ABW5DM05_9PROT
MSMHHIGVDLGGTKVDITLSGAAIEKPLWRDRKPTVTDKGPGGLIAQLATMIQEARAKADGPTTVGLGLPGSIDPQSGEVRNCVMPWLDGTPLPALLSQAVGAPVAFINDAQAFALSEANFGAGRNARIVLGITIGTGVGGGWVIDGRVQAGRHGIAGEIGHIAVEMSGRECYCGRRGCLEQYLSGTALERRYYELTGRNTRLAVIAERAGSGDVVAASVLAEMVEAFGVGVGSLVNAFDPDVIVVGGGVSLLPILFDAGRTALARQAMAVPFKTPVVRAKLGDASGVFGAALIGRQSQA